MIVTSLSVAREREQGTLDQLLVSPLTTQIFIGKAVPALIVATFRGHHCAGDWYLGVSNPFAGSLALFYFTMVIYGLSLVGIRSVDFITLFNTTAGVYRRVCLYDARHSPFRLRFAGGKHASVAAKSDVD